MTEPDWVSCLDADRQKQLREPWVDHTGAEGGPKWWNASAQTELLMQLIREVRRASYHAQRGPRPGDIF